MYLISNYIYIYMLLLCINLSVIAKDFKICLDNVSGYVSMCDLIR